jgi:succinate dehydrogenase / fumarate reductase, cytochrome b subunit
MSAATPQSKAKRPEFRNLNVFTDLTSYRLPIAGYVSILHRVSGVLMFLLLPFIIWMFDASVSSEFSFAKFRTAFVLGIPFFGLFLIPAWIWKLLALAVVWAYLHHLVAGLRHLYMDVNHAVSKEFGQRSAIATFAISLPLTAAVAYKMFF